MKIDQYSTKYINYHAGQMEEGILYVSSKADADGVKGVWYICPCGCGIYMRIPYVGKRKWDIIIKDDKVTLSPSILLKTHCKSHYFIRDGRVVWA